MSEDSKKKIVVVDDEEDIRSFLVEFFQQKGYAVTAAGTREEAFKILRAVDPHVALLDVRMLEERDGLEVLKWIKEQKLMAKVIMVTAVEAKDVIKEANALGADDYITKPLSLEYLESAVYHKVRALEDAT